MKALEAGIKHKHPINLDHACRRGVNFELPGLQSLEIAHFAEIEGRFKSELPILMAEQLLAYYSLSKSGDSHLCVVPFRVKVTLIYGLLASPGRPNRNVINRSRPWICTIVSSCTPCGLNLPFLRSFPSLCSWIPSSFTPKTMAKAH
jgi:hypothetical protein